MHVCMRAIVRIKQVLNEGCNLGNDNMYDSACIRRETPHHLAFQALEDFRMSCIFSSVSVCAHGGVGACGVKAMAMYCMRGF